MPGDDGGNSWAIVNCFLCPIIGFFRYLRRVQKSVRTRPNINPLLLWEYDWEQFDFEKSARLVIERVIQRGRLSDWQGMVDLYGIHRCIEAVNASKQLNSRERSFAGLFLQSDWLHA